MTRKYSIIVGPNPDGLFFTPLAYVAHARIGSYYAYCTAPYDDSGVLHYGRLNDFLALQPEDEVLARRLFIDFDGMSDRELTARLFAMKTMESAGGIHRVESFDKSTSVVEWYISNKESGESRPKTSWETGHLSGADYIDFWCNKFRISVTCNEDLGEVIQWTAESPHFSHMSMVADTRSRAVVQLVLWAFYQRTPFSYVGQEYVNEILKSHAVEV